jgi:hypothetical protein
MVYDKYFEKEKYWNKQVLVEYMSPVNAFQEKHAIPSNRIFVGEFTADRRTPGLKQYFQDLIEHFTTMGYHACVYTILPDDWWGFDYEDGSWLTPKLEWHPGFQTDCWPVLSKWLQRSGS